MPPRSKKNEVIAAIDKLERRVSAADIATSTGMALQEANYFLNQIAQESHAHLEVSKEGHIAYHFSPGFQAHYLTRGLSVFFKRIFGGLQHLLWLMVKVSFGLFLVASLLVNIGVMYVILHLTKSPDTRRSSHDDFYLDLVLLRELILWGRVDHLKGINLGEKLPRPKERTNFFLNCYSFLFGDGDANAHIEDLSWKIIAETIRKSGGVVTCEQIFPYLVKTQFQEDAMLPVLCRYDGYPTVSEQGHILYTFPSLQISTNNQEIEPESNYPYLEEAPQVFSRVDRHGLTPIITLATLNCLGTGWLFFFYAKFLHCYPPLVVTMAAYGLLFLLLPALRRLFLFLKNAQIKTRNKKRASCYENLVKPSQELKEKLLEAQGSGIGINHLSTEELIYTTEKDLLEQEKL
jgi:hypothetical protein